MEAFVAPEAETFKNHNVASFQLEDTMSPLISARGKLANLILVNIQWKKTQEIGTPIDSDVVSKYKPVESEYDPGWQGVHAVAPAARERGR